MNFHNFQRKFLEQSIMNMEMSELMMSSPHKFPCILYVTFFFFFVKACPHIRANIILHSFSVNIYMANFTFSKLKYGIFVISVNKILMENCEGDDINSLICIFISTVQDIYVSLKITKIQNFHSFVIFLIRFTSNFHCYVWFVYSWVSPWVGTQKKAMSM